MVLMMISVLAADPRSCRTTIVLFSDHHCHPKQILLLLLPVIIIMRSSIITKHWKCVCRIDLQSCRKGEQSENVEHVWSEGVSVLNFALSLHFQ